MFAAARCLRAVRGTCRSVRLKLKCLGGHAFNSSIAGAIVVNLDCKLERECLD